MRVAFVGKEHPSTGKSIRRSVAIDKYSLQHGRWMRSCWIASAYKNPDGEKDGSSGPNGSLQISGALEARKNKDGNPEIKARRFRFIAEAAKATEPNPSKPKTLRSVATRKGLPPRRRHANRLVIQPAQQPTHATPQFLRHR